MCRVSVLGRYRYHKNIIDFLVSKSTSHPRTMNSCPTQPQPDDLSRNLFPEPTDDNDDVDDPFAVDADFSDQLGLIETFDPVRFLLSHVRIDVADPEFFKRLKAKVFTVQHAIELVIKEDAYFRNQLAHFYSALATMTGLDMRAEINRFRSDGIQSQTCAPELVEPMLIYCLYRTAKLPTSGVPAYLTTQAQEVIEIALRTERRSLVSLMQQCSDGTARYSNSHFLCGASLQDSRGQLFMMDSTIKSKYLNILGICTSLYLTSNCALLCDITELVQRLIVGQAKSHGLKQLVVGHSLERIEIWLARRKSVFDDLHNACSMLGLFAEMPGPCALVADAMGYALNPAFVSILRVVVRQNGVPRNALTWTDFEYLLADTPQTRPYVFPGKDGKSLGLPLWTKCYSNWPRASAPSDAVSDRSMVEMARQTEHRNDPWTERARREMQDRCMTEKVRQIGHRMDPWTDRARQIQHHLDPWIDILRARQMIMSKEWTRGHICQVRWSIGWIQGQSGHVKYRSSD